MRLIHLQIGLDFAGEFHSYSISEQLYKELTGRTPRTVEHLAEPGVVIRSTKRRQLVAWDKDSCSVIMESEFNAEECFDKMVTLLETINKVAPIGKLAERRFITYWLLPMEKYSFKSLEQKYREILMMQQPIWGNTTDSSIVLDIKVKDSILHHQSGPMQVKQLGEDYSVFKLANVPKLFLFLWASVHNKKVVEYSAEDIRSFLSSSFELCENHSKLFESIWREIK